MMRHFLVNTKIIPWSLFLFQRIMDDLDFSKILQDAESLTSEIEASTDLPRVQRNLRQVLEAGQLLLNRNSKQEPMGINTETQA